MCGIVGYIGNKDSLPILLSGLKRLEYRGYDSAGVALFYKNKISIHKTKGKIKDLEEILNKRNSPFSGVGIAHTRWATHGAPNSQNAHPHTDCSGNIALVHNGIIENYEQLKKDLIKEGHRFKSETDTEVIAHLVEKFYKGDLEKAVFATIKYLRGSFAIAVMSAREPGRLIAARLGSPLIVGISNDGNFIASDVPAILEYTKKVIYLKDKQICSLTKDKVKLMNFSGQQLPLKPEIIKWDIKSAQKEGFAHFMLKEIHQQPGVIGNIFNRQFKDIDRLKSILNNTRNIIIVACGTAYHAGLVGKYVIEGLSKIPVWVDLSSEFRYRKPIVDKNTLTIAISQSGETADTLAAVREAKSFGSKIISICNVVGSSLTRESDAVLYTYAGPEISVASTKAYTAQLSVLYLLGIYLGKLKKTVKPNELARIIRLSKNIHKEVENVIKKLSSDIKKIAAGHHHFGCFLFLGRNINFPSALEGALKLKEISYIPAEGYAAGEMKHGPIALIDEYRAIMCIAPDSDIYEKMVSNIQEVKSRKGKIIIIATEGNKYIKKHSQEVIYIPKVDHLFSPILVAPILQLFAYYVAIYRGCDVDQPRNLAKSVTVE